MYSPDIVISPSQVAEPLQALQRWRLPDADPLALHRGILEALGAMDKLTQLEMPLAVNLGRPGGGETASRSSSSPLGECETLRTLLSTAESTLTAYQYRSRIAEVSRRAPGHATQLERGRRSALAQVRRLRARLDFITREAVQQPKPNRPKRARPAQSSLH